MIEIETMWRAIGGESLARFGDGELKLCHGEDSLTETWDEDVAEELREILRESTCMVGIPHARGVKRAYWEKFLKTHSDYFVDREYMSSFVSRPDEVDGIDTLQYRRLIPNLWRKREVALVTGGKSLDAAMMQEARHIDLVWCSDRDAAKEVDDIEACIPKRELTILCCGAAGTILAHRLANKGLWAVDMGYIGKFL